MELSMTKTSSAAVKSSMMVAAEQQTCTDMVQQIVNVCIDPCNKSMRTIQME